MAWASVTVGKAKGSEYSLFKQIPLVLLGTGHKVTARVGWR
jgi:hypothetical protein